MTKNTSTPSKGDDFMIDSLLSDLGAIADDGLKKWLKDADLSRELVEWIHEETGFNKARIRLVFNIASPLLIKVSAKSGKWLGEIGRHKFSKLLKNIPQYEPILGKLKELGSRLDERIAQKRTVQDILAGKRSPRTTGELRELSLDLQASVSLLAKIDQEAELLQDGLERIFQKLTKEPPLYLPSLHSTLQARFIYSAQAIPFIGRERELATLEEFLFSGHPFAWWHIYGPGGTGKSRLALEFCLRQGGAWRVGFLTQHREFDFWDEWEPTRPTLIVADYASSRAEYIRKIILGFIQREKPPDLPVRLLLLDRQAKGPVIDSIKGWGAEAHAVEQRLYADPLEMTPLTNQDLLSIMGFYGADSEEKRAAGLATLYSMDTEVKRPLFAAFIGDALAGGRNPRSWDRNSLLKDVLERQMRKYWEPAGVTDADKNLLALTTLCNGLSWDQYGRVRQKELFSGPEGLTARFASMTGLIGLNGLPPLEPDLIGELYVLEHLKPDNPADKDRLIFCLEEAWYINPTRMSYFLVRICMDFVDHPARPLLMGIPKLGSSQRRWWAEACTLFCWILPGQNRVEKAWRLYRELADLAREHADEAVLRERQGNGAFNLITHLGGAGRVGEARELYGELADLAREHTGEAVLRKEQAKGAVNLITFLVLANRWEEARELYRGLAVLAWEHGGEATLRQAQARVTFNLIYYSGKVGRLEDAQELYRELAALARKHAGEAVLRKEQVKGAVKLIEYLVRGGRLEEAWKLYRELTVLAREHAGEAALREWHAKGAVNLIIYLGGAGRREQALELYWGLAVLAREHAGEPGLREWQAKGADTLLTYFFGQKQDELAEPVFQDLVQLIRSYPHEPLLNEIGKRLRIIE